MNLSRRSFVYGTAAALTLPAWSAPTKPRSPKKGIGGPPPANSGLSTSWYYNWTFNPSAKGMPVTDPGMTFRPMCWSWHGEKSKAALDLLRPSHPSVLFGFNEPDQKEQGDISVETALDAWPALQGIADDLVSPSCAHPEGEWFERFMEGVESRKLHVDTIGVHHYGPPSPEEFTNMLKRIHDRYKRPLWVTEFAVADWNAKVGGPANRYSVEQVLPFMKSVCEFMNETPWVRGYAWFPTAGRSTSNGQGPLAPSLLYAPTGELNELGKLYAQV